MPKKACQRHTKVAKHHHTHVYVLGILGVTFVILAMLYQFFVVLLTQADALESVYNEVVGLQSEVEQMQYERDELLKVVSRENAEMNPVDAEDEQVELESTGEPGISIISIDIE